MKVEFCGGVCKGRPGGGSGAKGGTAQASAAGHRTPESMIRLRECQGGQH